MNWPKIIGYVGITSIAVSIVAQFAAKIVPEANTEAQIQDMLRWAGYLWAYAAFIMGIVLLKATRRFSEIVWSLLVSALCLVTPLSFLAAIAYFVRAYAILDGTDWKLPF
ncbi:MAG: hypothetical protein N2491_06150 [Negativicutes bacterium]|nr:hypothetical protein [Negativicutes bacterium]